MTTATDVHDRLRRFLEDSCAALAARNSGSFEIAEFCGAKKACIAAGIPEAEVEAIVLDVAQRRRRL